MRKLKVSINLPRFSEAANAVLASHAQHAEEVGLESVWVGDHLILVVPFLDSTLVIATAAAATKHIRVGFRVMILVLRPVAWAPSRSLPCSTSLEIECCWG